MSDCIFCKIVSNQIPSAAIYEDDEFKVILDRFPSSIGHTLIISKEHIKNIFEMPADKGGRMFELAVKLAPIIKNQLNCDGINILQNNGVAAGQSVHHFHIHIIPRYKDDKLGIVWKQVEPTDEEIQQLAKKLSTAINIK